MWEYFVGTSWRQTKGGLSASWGEWKSDFNLKDMGHQGWELVSVVPISTLTGMLSGNTSEIHYYFRRPIEE